MCFALLHQHISPYPSGFAVDSRNLRKGDLFFALPGEKVDGHHFLQEVAEKGGCGAVVLEGYAGESYGLSLLRVKDVLLFLQQLALEKLESGSPKVIGVTGSVGKTTTKEFIAHLLAAKYRVGKTVGSSNSQIGFPLSLLQLKGDEEVLVLEMGMSKPGEIARLVQLAPPHIAVITRIALAHVANFPNGLEGIAAEKAEILSHPRTELAIIHETAAKYPCILHRGTCPKQVYTHSSCEVDLPFSESHLVEDFIAAATTALAMGLTWEEMGARCPTLRTIEMRYEKQRRNEILFINDAYNANPTSMQAALANLPTGKRRIAILGMMVELGAYCQSAHREVGEYAASVVDHLLCYGKECVPMAEAFQQAGKPVELFTDFSLLQSAMQRLIQGGDVVLIKGSKVNRLWRLLEEME